MLCPCDKTIAQGVGSRQCEAKERRNQTSAKSNQRGAREDPATLLPDDKFFLNFRSDFILRDSGV
jgi:hypothetical protein